MSQEISVLLSLRTANALGELNKFIAETSRGLKDIAAEAIASYASFEGFNKLTDAVKDAINLEESIGRLSSKTGLSVATLVSFREAANRVGVGLEEMNTSLGRFAQNIFDAATKGGSFAEAFDRMGVSLVNTDGTLKTTDVLLQQTAQWFATHADGVEKARTATELFGRAGRELIPILNQGSEGIQKMQAAGGPITDESVAQATEFNQSLRELHEQVEMIWVSVANKLLPSLLQMVKLLKDSTDSINTNGAAVEALAGIAKGLITIVSVLGLAFYELGEAIGIVANVYVDNFHLAMTTVKAVLLEVAKAIDDTIQLFLDLQSAAIAAGQTAYLVATGQYTKAAQVIKQTISEVQSDSKALYADVKQVGETSAAAFLKSLQNQNDGMKLFVDDVKKQWVALSDFLSGLWTGQKSAPAAKSGGAISAGTFTPGPTNEDLKTQQALNDLQDAAYKIQLKLIESDPYKTKAEKAQELIPIYDAQLKSLLGQASAEERLNKSATNEGQKIATAKELYKIQSQINDLSKQSNDAKSLTSFTSQFARISVSIRDTFGTVAQQAAKSFQSVFMGAINSISNGITGLIMGTKSWGQALMGIANQILTSIIGAIVEMGVRWIATQLLMAVTGEALQTASTAALVPIAAAQSAIWATPATLATIASYGAAAAEAPLAISLAEGLTLASIAGRETGGPVSAGTPYVVGEKRPELFVPSQSGYIIPQVPSPVANMSAPGAGGGNTINQQFAVHNWNDEAAMTKHIRDNPEVNHILIDKMKRNVHVIGARA